MQFLANLYNHLVPFVITLGIVLAALNFFIPYKLNEQHTILSEELQFSKTSTLSQKNLTFSLSETFCDNVTEIPSSECQVLVNLYNDTNGANWEDSPYNNWGTTKIPCQWWDVTCKDGHVISIKRRYQKLTGTLPDLSALTHLEKLDLSNNKLSGPIPNLSTLDRIQWFDLSGNQLNATAQIPHTFCQRVTDIPNNQCQVLITLYNKTDGKNWKNVPRGIETNSPCQWWGIKCEGGNVIAVDLFNNQLKGTIPDLSELIYLRILDLSYNNLNGSVPDLSLLVSLETFNLSGNQLIPNDTLCYKVKGIPTTQCQALIEIYNNTNGKEWTDTPSNLWGLTNTPCRWKGITCQDGNVIAIDRRSKGLKGLVSDLSRLAHLEKIDLSKNQLKVIFPIPETFCQKVTEISTTQCQLLIESYNNTNGKEWTDTPDNLWGLTNTPCSWKGITCQNGNVIAIDRRSKGLTGFVSDLSHLAHFEKLDLSENQLEVAFPIPKTFCQKVTEIPITQCHTLIELYNSTNGKEWIDTPDNFWGLTNTPCRWKGITCQDGNVIGIDRRSKGLTGFFPNLSHLAHFEKLDLSENQLEVVFPIPKTFCQKVTEIPTTQCQALIEFYNKTNGKEWTDTPDNFWGLTNTPCRWKGITCQDGYITVINRDSKGLKGFVPSLNGLTHLEEVDLSGNPICQNVNNKMICQPLVEAYIARKVYPFVDKTINIWLFKRSFCGHVLEGVPSKCLDRSDPVTIPKSTFFNTQGDLVFNVNLVSFCSDRYRCTINSQVKQDISRQIASQIISKYKDRDIAENSSINKYYFLKK